MELSDNGNLVFLLTPLREGRHVRRDGHQSGSHDFYSRPCGRGDGRNRSRRPGRHHISTHAPAGGATTGVDLVEGTIEISTHAPAGGATAVALIQRELQTRFLLTPLREGRRRRNRGNDRHERISTHAPAGGATDSLSSEDSGVPQFLLTPLREGRQPSTRRRAAATAFLLTPLREGRLKITKNILQKPIISTHAPAGGATGCLLPGWTWWGFLLTPLREGRPRLAGAAAARRNISTHAPAGGATASWWATPAAANFYSRPCGRGDGNFPQVRHEVLRQIAER